MKKLFLTLLLITGFFSSQTWGFVVPVKQVEYEGLVLRNDGLYYKEFTDIPFTGEISGLKGSYKPNGKFTFKNGKKDGVHERYYDNGQLSSKVNFKDGQKDGVWERYYDNGQLRLKENYKDGELDGLDESYYGNGQLRWKENYKDGELEGLMKIYNEDGSLDRTETYKNGVLVSE